jgi:hypothetical protein
VRCLPGESSPGMSGWKEGLRAYVPIKCDLPDGVTPGRLTGA